MSNIFENKGALGATIVVAASDSLNVGAANYVADGAADDVEIQAALDAASAIPGGGQVYLLEGNYATVANLTVPADVALVGAGFGTVITPDHADITQGIVLNDRSMLKNLKVILAAGCGTAGARPNTVYANGEAQIWIKDCWIVGDETVDDNNDLRQNGINFNTITHSKIIDCRIEDNKRHGIQLFDASNYNTVTGNTCEGNNQFGIFINESSYNTITGNICELNLRGIRLLTSLDNTITGNICQANTSIGISLTASDNNTIVGNTCQENEDSGMYIHSSANNTITGNNCQGSTQSGIRVASGSDNNTIVGNTVADNGKHGIYVATSSQNVITGNQCDDNGSGGTYHGIYIFRSSYCTVVGNVCNNNLIDGIHVTGDGTANADYNTLTANVCTGNGDDGIEIVGGGDANKNIVLGNQLLGNGGTPLVDNGANTVSDHNVVV